MYGLSKTAFSSSPGYLFGSGELHIVITNETKRQTWQLQSKVVGVPQLDEAMMFLSYWDIGNQLEVDNQMKISVDTREEYQVKEVGVHLVYKEEQGLKSAESTSKEEISQQISSDGNIVPGRFYPHPATTRVYRFPENLPDCPILDH